jgi:hypothetical protein
MTKSMARAAAKKCRAQLEGIGVAEKILSNIVRSGIHSVDSGNFALYSGQIKDLGSYYITGVQNAFTEFLLAAKRAEVHQESGFGQAIEKLNYLHALLKKGSAYLEKKATDLEAFPEERHESTDAMLHSSIEEELGYAWKLEELEEKGLVADHAELIQLSFNSYDDPAAKQLVDEGIWMPLDTGVIYTTYNYRPYRALKHLNPEDSCFQVTRAEKLYIYPGAGNPRVRWDKSELRPVEKSDLVRAAAYGRKDYAAVIKEIKRQLINPLGDAQPVEALYLSHILSGGDNRFQLQDEKGVKIVLQPEHFGYLLGLMSEEQVVGRTLVCRFHYDMSEDLLYANPLSLIGESGITRFYY